MLVQILVSNFLVVTRSIVLFYLFTNTENKKLIDCVKEIYPSELNVEKANGSDEQAKYLDLTFIIGNNNRFCTKLYDKREDFNFHIVDSPFLSSNIQSGPSYCVHVSQFIKYARCCIYYDDFRWRHELLLDRLLS